MTRPRSWLLPLGIYAASRVLTLALTVATATRQVPLDPAAVHVHAILSSLLGQALTGFDGQWYWTIADNGYPHEVTSGAQSPLAFLPLFPLLTRPLLAAGVPFEVAAPLLATVFGAVAVLLVHHLVAATLGRPAAITVTVLVCTHPASPVLNAAYAESLALALVAAALALIRDRRYTAAVPVVVALAFTRPVTAALLPMIVAHWVCAERAHRTRGGPAPGRARLALLTGTTAAAAFAAWPGTVWGLTGDRGAYLTTMASWPGFTGTLTRPPWLDAAVHQGPTGLIALTLVLTALAVLATRPQVRAWGPELWGWTFGYAALLLATTSPTLSLVRYCLLAFPLAALLAPTRGQHGVRAWAPTVVAAALSLAAQVVWLGQVFVFTGHGWGFP